LATFSLFSPAHFHVIERSVRLIFFEIRLRWNSEKPRSPPFRAGKSVALISYDIFIKAANDFRDLASAGNQRFDFL
jgi:hypothetical protein